MGETQQNLTAVTSEFGDSRPDRGLGVSIRENGTEIEYLAATCIEEHAPMDWTPDMAAVLLSDHGYEVTGVWTDIDETGEDSTWTAPVAELVSDGWLFDHRYPCGGFGECRECDDPNRE
ncbi:hypothetical protein ACNHUS_35345 [Actinomycetes bacterium M1A6_2h]